MSLHYNNRTNQIEAIGTAGTLVNFTGLGINNLVEDTTPQLGGDLDMNGNNIEGVTPTEMGYLSGVTSAIQTQLNGKAPTSHTHVEADITDLGSYLENVVEDTTPQLGADLDVNGHTFSIGASTGAANQVPTSNGAGGLSWAAPQVVADTTPQLGGDLDMNSNNITAAGPTTISPTEVSYLDGVTSNIQDQLDALAGGGGGTVQGSDATYDIQAANEGTVAGNARGENSVDLQTDRALATQVASGVASGILWGHDNLASGADSMAGGYLNTSSNTYTIAMGDTNTASGASSIAMGNDNTASNGFCYAIGSTNSVTGYSSLGFGWSNTVAGGGAVCLGGSNSIAGFDSDCIAIGTSNNISGGTGTTGNRHVAIGYDNDISANGGTSTIVGGFSNDITGGSSNSGNAIFGAVLCTIDANQGSNILGGSTNTITTNGTYNTICGGLQNDITSGDLGYNVIGGGYGNTNSGGYSVCCGGDINTAGYRWTFIGGGRNNSSAGDFNGIGCGDSNITSGSSYSTILGGRANTITAGSYSAVIGGWQCDVTASYALAFGRQARAIHSGAMVFADGSAAADFDSIATNEFAIRASGLRLVDGNQTNGYVLTCDANGTGTWQVNAANDADAIHDNVAGEIALISSKATPIGADLVLIEDSADSNNKKRATVSSLASAVGAGTKQASDGTYDIQPTNEGAVAGNARGENSVDLQTERNAANQIASATYSVIVGGARNRVDESYSSILGGYANYIAASSLSGYHVILGGSTNTISATTGEFNAIVSGETNQIGVTTAASDYCFIGSGQQHTVDGNYGVVCGGLNCDMNTPFYGFHGNGSQNNLTSTGDYNTILNGFSHDLTGSSDYGLILQGNNNQVSAFYATVINGVNCTATQNGALVAGNTNDCASSYGVCFGSVNDVGTGGQCSILGGSSNDIFAGNSNTICGGQSNVITTAQSDYNFIGCGSSNTIGGVGSDRNAICAGATNAIGTTHASFNCFIGSGSQNLINADYGVIGGGLDNEIQTGGDYTFIGSGTDHIVNALYCVVAGGHTNVINTGSNYAVILGGLQNTITTADHSYVLGSNCTISSGADYSQVSGYYGDAYNYGQRARASGRFAATGDAQTSEYTIRRALNHINNSWYDLTPSGANLTGSNGMVLKANATWTFDGIVVGSNDAQSKTIHWRVTGAIKNVGGTMTLKNAVVDVIDNSDDTLYECQVVANTTYDALSIQVRRSVAGAAPADSMRWVAHVRTVEVIY